MSEISKPIVLFDGVCNLCNGAVRFIYPRDQWANLLFASLQSEYGQHILEKYDLPIVEFDTILFLEGEQLYTQSTAILRIVRFLRFPWPLTRIFILIPRFIRDAVYAWISRNRYRWFGQLDVCPVPPPDMQARFIV